MMKKQALRVFSRMILFLMRSSLHSLAILPSPIWIKKISGENSVYNLTLFYYVLDVFQIRDGEYCDSIFLILGGGLGEKYFFSEE